MKPSLLFIAIFLVQLLSAQSFTEVIPSPFFDGVDVGSISFFDADGDDDLDVLITGATESGRLSKLYFNDGQGGFSEVTETPFTSVSISSASIADIDGDNDQDVLITGLTGSSPSVPLVKLYTNDGLGAFSEVTGTLFEQVYGGSSSFSDVDGDGDQDILITGLNSSSTEALSKLYLNDGSGNFSGIMGTPFEGVSQSSIAFCDVDGDDDQDVLITGENSLYNPVTKLYINNGAGNYTEMIDISFESVSQSSVAFSDVDGDEDQDVLITGRISSGSSVSKLYINDGLGNFTEMMDSPFVGVEFSSIAFSDVDGDNDQDILITGAASLSPTSKLYINDGLGNYSESMIELFDDVMFSTVAFSDIDGDNDEDVLIIGRDDISFGVRSTKLYINNSTVSSTETSLDRNIFDFEVCSNPTTASEITIRFQSNEHEILTASIFDAEGRKISEIKRHVTSKEGSFPIDISNLPKGIYVIQLNNGLELVSHKFVIQ